MLISEKTYNEGVPFLLVIIGIPVLVFKLIDFLLNATYILSKSEILCKIPLKYWLNSGLLGLIVCNLFILSWIVFSDAVHFL